MSKMKLKDYVQSYGPTVGCEVRLGDTDFMLDICDDRTIPGQEVIFGLEGNVPDLVEYESKTWPDFSDIPDTVITNVIIVCATGCCKADVGFKDGSISAIGNAGNYFLQKNVSDKLSIGPTTRCINGAGKILTPGAVDINFDPIDDSIFNSYTRGVTTQILNTPIFGKNLGEVDYQGSNRDIKAVFSIAKGKAQNIAIMAPFSIRNNTGYDIPLEAAGITLFPLQSNVSSNLEYAYNKAESLDVPFSFMIPSYDEKYSIDDILKITNKWSKNKVANLIDPSGSISGLLNNLELLNSSHLNAVSLDLARHGKMSDNKIALSIINQMIFFGKNTHTEKLKPWVNSSKYAAEDFLIATSHINICSSWGMNITGGDSFKTLWDMCSKFKQSFPDDINISKIIAKYTLNPAIAYGLSEYVGSIQVGKRADVVLWNPKNFPIIPDAVFIGGELAFTNSKFSVQDELLSLSSNQCGEGIRFVSKGYYEDNQHLYKDTKFMPVIMGGSTHRRSANISVDPENGAVEINGKEFLEPESRKLTNNRVAGEVIIPDKDIIINESKLRETFIHKVDIMNKGVWPVIIGSHTNLMDIKDRIIVGDREEWEMVPPNVYQYVRLDIPSGKRVIIMPGEIIQETIIVLAINI